MPLRYSAVQLFDLGYGPRLVSVTPPDCVVAPQSKIRAKDCGKAPGYLTGDGWTGASVNDFNRRCLDYQTAKLWDDGWNANAGLVGGDGIVILDNDQGQEFSRVLRALLPNAPRRYVLAPKHHRDAFLVRVVNGDTAEPEDVANQTLQFQQGLASTELQVLARGKQAVIAGTHPGTRMPYVWESPLPPYDEIPMLTRGQFDETIRKFVLEVRKLGWESSHPSQPVSAAPPVSGVSAPAYTQASAPPPSSIFADAEELLAQIPNREVPPGETPNAIDQWLDAYDNWIRVGYGLAAFFASHASDPRARAVWRKWSDGRPQPDQSSDSVWTSILAGPPPRFGEIALLEIIRQFHAAAPDFPDLDPNDPALTADRRPIWRELRRRWAFCKAKGFVDTYTGRVYDRNKFSDGEAHRARALAREFGLRGRTPSVANLFLSQPDRIEVFDITYAPGDIQFVPSPDSAMPSFNSWRPTSCRPAEIAAVQIAIWLDHLEYVLGSVAERDRFLRWCAFVVQNPRLKPNWHFLILSDPGFGKDAMLLPIMMAVGDGNFIDMLSYALAEAFNPWAEHKLIIVGEMAQSKSGASEVNTRLKPLLAQPPRTLTINNKHLRQYEIPNRCAVIMFSNDANPLPLERKSRRIHVVNRRGAEVRDQSYYKCVYDWLTNGGAELCASYLLAYPLTVADCDEFVGGVAPLTTDKEELEDRNVHPHQAALEELIADARDGGADTPRCLVATARELSNFLLQNGNKNPPLSHNVSSLLMDMEKKPGSGVYRIKRDPKPTHCGVVSAMINGVKYVGRLWALAETTADGRKWGSLTEVEIVSIWKNLTPPKSGSLHVLVSDKGKDFPEEEAV